jgi:hypothetical protein
MDGSGFEDAMLAKHGCRTVEAVAGHCRPAGVLAVVLNKGIMFSPTAFATLLVNWFGGNANSYRVQPCQRGAFLFQVDHECIAKEIVLRDPWRSGIISVGMSLSGLTFSACRGVRPAHACSDVRRRAWVANSLLPSLLGPRPSCAPSLPWDGNHLIAPAPRA